MPRDEPYPRQYESTDPSGKGPLKRGDACLYCRKRRIRCSAEKPTCQHCTKLQRECIYDSGKPVSRVKQLEDKVAELEDMLKLGGPGAPSTSSTGTPSGGFGTNMPGLPTRTSSGSTPNDNVQSYGNGGFGMDNATAGSSTLQPPYGYGYQMESFHPAQHSTLPPNSYSFPTQDTLTFGTSRVDQDAVDMFDFTSLDPGFMNLVNSFGAASTGPDLPDGVLNGLPNGLQGGLPSGLQNGLPNDGPPILGQPIAQSQAPHALSMNGAQSIQHPHQPLHSASVDFDIGMELDFIQPSGLTPFMDPTNGQGLGAPLGSTPLQYIPNNNISPSANTPPTAVPRAISIQPVQQDERVSYHAYVSAVPDSVTPPEPASERQPSMPDGQQSWMRDQNQYAPDDHHRQCANGVGVLPTLIDPVAVAKSAFDSGWRSWTKDPPGTEEAKTLVGGWFDPTDLPRVARDHLLDLFFAGMRMFGQEFHIPRFFASLSLPAGKRPHPCLMYSMYLMACRISSSLPIRSLEKHFYAIALEKLDESFASADRLFDAIRAATIIAVYQYSVAKFHEAFMMTSRAARLAVSCGLHAISSSVFRPSSLPKDHRAELIGLMRQRSWILPPPTDAVSLGERIWAFWAIFTVDRCGSISTQWPPGIPDDIVTTPFPRPLAEYELGLVTTADDVSLSMLYDPRPRQPMSHYSDSIYMNLRMRGMAIFERASKLAYLKPERGWDEHFPPSGQSSSYASPYSGNTGASQTSTDGVSSYERYSTRPDYASPTSSGSPGGGTMPWTRTPQIRTPKAYAEVTLALTRVEEDLPPTRRTNWEVWDGSVDEWQFAGDSGRREVFLLHFILGCSWMYAFDVNSWNEPNPRAVSVGRRLARAVRSVVDHDLNTDLDVFMCMTWAFVLKILIREFKRLQAIGDMDTAKPIEEDVQHVIQAMETFGKKYSIAAFQAMRLKAYMDSTVEDYRFLGELADSPEFGETPRGPDGR